MVAVLAYAASYFARGFLAGNHRFGLYGALVFMEASSRVMFALVVAVGIAEGQSVVALGIAAAPLASLLVLPWALGRRMRRQQPVDERARAAALAAEEVEELAPGSQETEFTLGARLLVRHRGARGDDLRADAAERRARCS